MASNPVPMSAQMLDALKAVSERYHASHERRVGHELQVVIACLGLFAAVAAFRLSTSFAGQSNPAFVPVVLGSFLALCLLATVYLKTSANSNALDLEKARAADQDIVNYLRTQAACPNIQAVVDHNVESPSKNRWIWEFLVVWAGAGVSVTLMLAQR